MKVGKWKLGVPLCLLVFALMLLGGCGGGSDNPAPQAGALEKWAGTWTSLARFVADPVMTPFYEKIAAGVAQDYTVGGIAGYFVEMFGADFDGMRISGDSVTFLNGDKVLGSARYEQKGLAKNAMGEEFLQFQMVEGSESTPAGSAFKPSSLVKFLALSPDGPVSKDDEGKTLDFLRVPVRYSGESMAAMMQGRPTWTATFGSAGVTAEDVRKELEKNLRGFIAFFSTELRPFTAWEGTWMSAITFLDDPAMTPVYKTVSKKAAIKGKKTNTPEAVKGAFKAMLNSDFGGMRLEQNTVAILNADGTLKEKLSYIRDRIETRSFGEYSMNWTVFEAKSASAYKYLVLLPSGKDSADGFVHFHMRYGGTSVEALLDTPALQGWFPTLCEKGTTVAKFAADMLEGVDEMVEMLP